MSIQEHGNNASQIFDATKYKSDKRWTNRWAICLSMREENQYGDIY